MSSGDQPCPPTAAGRAELLPEEQVAGSDDPEGQAEAVLADSEQRSTDRDGTPAPDPEARFEHRHSEDTVDPRDSA